MMTVTATFHIEGASMCQQTGATGGGSSTYTTTMTAEVATPRVSNLTNQKLTSSTYPTSSPVATVTEQPRASMHESSIKNVSDEDYLNVMFYYGHILKTSNECCIKHSKDCVTCTGSYKACTQVIDLFKQCLSRIEKEVQHTTVLKVDRSIVKTFYTDIQKKSVELQVNCIFANEIVKLNAKFYSDLEQMTE